MRTPLSSSRAKTGSSTPAEKVWSHRVRSLRTALASSDRIEPAW
jgi:hypothetical protein